VREIALHLLDIAENSVAANAKNITIAVLEDIPGDRLKASVADDGRGMDAEMVARVMDPFVTSRTTRKVGLGIPLLKLAAESCEGSLKITSELGKGTCLEVEFKRSHIDRMPLGDMAATILNLVVAYPVIHWIFQYAAFLVKELPVDTFLFDDRPIKEELGDVPFTEPAVLSFLREYIEQGVFRIQEQLPEAV
jgi:hypothetical protein